LRKREVEHLTSIFEVLDFNPHTTEKQNKKQREETKKTAFPGWPMELSTWERKQMSPSMVGTPSAHEQMLP
jgi:hypothetical protein